MSKVASEDEWWAAFVATMKDQPHTGADVLHLMYALYISGYYEARPEVGWRYLVFDPREHALSVWRLMYETPHEADIPPPGSHHAPRVWWPTEEAEYWASVRLGLVVLLGDEDGDAGAFIETDVAHELLTDLRAKRPECAANPMLLAQAATSFART